MLDVNGAKRIEKKPVGMKELFTIGHSNHSLDRFIELLLAHRLSNVADVRSSPYSKYTPQFNKDVLDSALRNANIDYIFLGRELGAQRSEDDWSGKIRSNCQFVNLPAWIRDSPSGG